MSSRDFQSDKINNAYVLIGLTRKNEINRPRVSKFKQPISAILIATMLTVSAPAAPETIAGSAKETAQDIRFAWLSRSFAIESPWSLFAAFLKPRTSTPSSVVTRIEVFPGAKTVRQGEQVTFAAVGYDTQNEIVSGLDFRWQVADTGRNLRPRPLVDSTFEPKVHGTFVVTATHENLQAQAEITVTPSPAGSSTTNSLKSGEPILVSSRDAKTASKNLDNNNTPMSASSWNNENWQSFDDPGNQIGNPPGSPADGGAGNGNFQLSAPVVSLPGRGIDIALNLNYNSRLWNKSGAQITFDIDHGFPAPGWSLGFGKIMDMGSNGGSMLIDADGTRHGYTGTIWPMGGSYSLFRGFTTDGKFIDYNSYRDNTGIYWAWAYLPNGTYISYGARGSGAVYPTYIRDASGNFITITYRNNQGPSIETITDTVGRVITFQYDSLGRFISAKAPRMQGEPDFPDGKTRTLVKVHYKPLTLAYWFGGGYYGVAPAGPIDVIDAIYYPATNTGYWFNDADSYSSYGMITKVVEQRGMNWTTGAEEQGIVTAGTMTKKAEYNYPLTTANETGRTNGADLLDAPTYTELKENWDRADVNEPAITTYAINDNDWWTDPVYGTHPARTITVVQPNGVVSKQYTHRNPGVWSDGVLFRDETKIVNGTTETIIAKSTVFWEPGDYLSPRPASVEAIDEKGHKIKTAYTYGTGLFNQITRSCDYDNGNNLLRCSNATYENSQSYKGTWYSYNTGNGIGWYFGGGRHIFSLPLTTTIENPDGSIASRTNYEYDSYQNNAFLNTPGVIQHDPTHDPYTNVMMWVQGSCIQWEPGPYGDPVCVNWEYYEVPVYDPATDKRGNVTKTTSYSDAQAGTGAIVETKGYDIDGNLVKASSSCCEQTSILYTANTQFAYPESQTRGSADTNSPHRITTSSVHDGDTGLLKSSTDANGRTSTLNYNPDTLRPVKSTSSTGAYSTWTYNESDMTVIEETRESNGNLAGKTKKTLNGLGLTIKEESYGPSNVIDIVEAKYTKFAEPWKQSRPYRAGEQQQWSEKFYDLQGRVTKVVEPDGSETKAFYNEAAYPDSATLVSGSLPPGNTIRVMDAWGRARWGRYDQQERLVEVVEPNPNGNGDVLASGSLVTKYSYDTLNRLTQTDQGGQLRKFKYDSLGRMTRQKLAEQTATLNDAGAYIGANQTGANWAEAFIYDNRSNLTQQTDARGVRTNFSYQLSGGGDDPLNRIQARWYDISGPLDPGLTVHGASGVLYSYMTTGDKERISQIRTDGVLTENFAYDGEGRVSHYTQTVDFRTSYPMQTSYLYDTLDRVKEVTYPAQYGLVGNPRKVVAHAYDTASRLTSLTYNGGQQAGNIVYNASDQTTSMKVGVAGTNQVTENYSFDPQTGLLINQQAVRNGQTLLNLSYDYNRNNAAGTLNGKTGHLTKIIDNLNNNKNREYEFDAVGRLTKAKGGVNGALWNQQYSYDRYGNRTNVTKSGVAADNSPIPLDGIPNLTYNPTSNRINASEYEYDSAGNQTRSLAEDGTWLKYEYDAANRLRVVKRDNAAQTTLQAFNYGSSNQRLMDLDYGYGLLKIFASIGGTTLNEYTEYAGAVPTWTKSYTYLGDSQLSTITPNGAGGETFEYNHPDRLGTKLTTDPQTGAVSEQTTLPFGKTLAAESGVVGQMGTTSGTGASTKKFTSYDRSVATGLDYAINRTYDNKLGRFTQVDPIDLDSVDPMDPQTLNLYIYCGNDPVNNTDPDGLFFKAIAKFFKKLFTSKWFLIAVSIAISVITIGAGLGLWSLTSVVVQQVSIMGYTGVAMTLSISTTQIALLGWITIGLGIAAAIPAMTSVKALLTRIAGNAIGHFVGSITNYLMPQVGSGGTPTYNPDSVGNDFLQPGRRTFRRSTRRRGPGSWAYGWRPVRIPSAGVGYSQRYPRDYPTRDTVNLSASFRSKSEAIAEAMKKLGLYVKIDNGKWRSMNGKWQFRAKPGDIAGRHVHLERLDSSGRVLTNWHYTWPGPREGVGRGRP